MLGTGQRDYFTLLATLGFVNRLSQAKRFANLIYIEMQSQLVCKNKIDVHFARNDILLFRHELVGAAHKCLPSFIMAELPLDGNLYNTQ